MEQENVLWVAEGVGSSSWIMNVNLSFMMKDWWTLVCHRLSPIYGENILNPDRVALIAVIMEGYHLNVAK